MFSRTNLIILLITYVGLSSSLIADWRSPYFINHPLVGKIYSPKEKSWVTKEHVTSVMQDSKFILIGETHTNPDHHQGQATLIASLLNNQSRPRIVLEMLSLESWRGKPQVWSSIQDLNDTLELVAKHWAWDLYQPILKLAVKKQLPILPANLGKQKRRYFADPTHCRIKQDGIEINFCDTIITEQKSIIGNLILKAHCGYIQAQRLSPLVNIQIAKDASFALSLYRAGKKHKAILIAGAVHVRKDIGVPIHLQSLGGSSISIAFIAVDPTRTAPDEYIDSTEQFDYIFFTPNERNIDPCVEFKEQLKKMKKSNAR